MVTRVVDAFPSFSRFLSDSIPASYYPYLPSTKDVHKNPEGLNTTGFDLPFPGFSLVCVRQNISFLFPFSFFLGGIFPSNLSLQGFTFPNSPARSRATSGCPSEAESEIPLATLFISSFSLLFLVSSPTAIRWKRPHCPSRVECD